jgi:hypothetical protein
LRFDLSVIGEKWQQMSVDNHPAYGILLSERGELMEIKETNN